MRNNLKAHAALIGANIIYGLNYVIAKGIMPDYLQPRAIIFMRALGTMLIFWILGFIAPRERVGRRDMVRLAICSLFGVALNQILFFEGLNLTTPINAAIIITVIPIMVLVFSYWILHERITRLKSAGILLGATGAVMIILAAGTIDLRSSTFLGNILIFINASSYAAYIVLIKPVAEKYHPFTIMKWIFLFGFLLITPVSLHVFAASDFTSVPVKIWFSVAYVVIASTGLAYLLNNYSLRTVRASVNGIYIYMQPLIASVVAVIIGQDRITATKIISSLLILIGVYFVSKPTRMTSLNNFNNRRLHK